MRRNGHEKSRGWRPTPQRSCPGFFRSVKLYCHARGPRPSCGTLWNRTPASRLYGSRGLCNCSDSLCVYHTLLLSTSAPFLSGSSAACPPRERVGERIGKDRKGKEWKGMEWVIDKSFLDFSLYTYIFILLRWIFRRRFSRQRIIRRRENQQRCKEGKARQSCLALCRFYRAEAGLSSRPQK